MSITTFEDARIALKPYIPSGSQHTGKQGLHDMQAFMGYLDNPQEKLRIIHVAGTSGKTSTCYYLSSLLVVSGKRTGLTVSPHVDSINERIQIDGLPVPEREFCSELEEFLKLVRRSEVDLIYFQILIAFAFWYFAKAGVEYAVVETGFGGLLDNTNIVKRSDKISVITDIGYDHMHILGETIPEIAEHKAGIIHRDNHVFMHDQSDEVMSVMRRRVSKVNANLHIKDGLGKNADPVASLPLFQQRNWSLAYNVYEWLQQNGEVRVLSPVEIQDAAQVTVPARMESMRIHDKTVIFDGAHNSQKIAALAESLRLQYKNQSVATLISIVQSRDFRTRIDLRPLMEISSNVIVTGFGGVLDGPKHSVDLKELADFCGECGAEEVRIVESPEEATVELLRQPQTVLLITGSFYLMNHTRPYLLKIAKS